MDNAIGGYRSARLYFADQVSVSVSLSSASISSDVQGWDLPVSENKISLYSEARGDGSYTHSVEITLKASGVDAQDASLLRQISRRGALIVGEDFSGRTFLFGDRAYPLSGTADEIHGTAHADLHCWRLALSCTCLHPELPLL